MGSVGGRADRQRADVHLSQRGPQAAQFNQSKLPKPNKKKKKKKKNAAPQAAQFNQSRLLWAGLEDYVLEHARTYRQRLCVFTGPVLAADDPPYRGVQIPRRFFKIAAWATSAADGPEQLAATGYLLDQTPELPDLPAATARARSPASRRRSARTAPTRCRSPTSPR